MRDAETRGQGNRQAGDRTPSLLVPLSSAPSAASHLARRRLAHLLIAKSITEALIVGALAAGFIYLAFNPYFRGSLDRADAKVVSGWVVDDARPSSRVEVQLYVDGRFVASTLADQPRPDVLAAGRSRDERHGFVFTVPTREGGEHEARAYAVHESGGGTRRTLQIIGRPLRFHVAP